MSAGPLIGRVERSRRSSLELTSDSHCRCCPAFASCSAQPGAAQALIEEKLEELTLERTAEVWERLLAVEAAAKKVRKVLADYIDNRGERIPLQDGRELRLFQTRRDTILSAVALPLLRDRYAYRLVLVSRVVFGSRLRGTPQYTRCLLCAESLGPASQTVIRL